MKRKEDHDFLFWLFIIFLMIMISNSGCTGPFRSEMKCEGGVLYIKDNGAWIQALMYKDNKCLPGEVK